MLEFTAYCPRCNSGDLKLRGMHIADARGVESCADASVFAYRCLCGLSFTLEIKPGQQPVCKSAGLREQASADVRFL
jgi:hypothetical protein